MILRFAFKTRCLIAQQGDAPLKYAIIAGPRDSRPLCLHALASWKTPQLDHAKVLREGIAIGDLGLIVAERWTPIGVHENGSLVFGINIYEWQHDLLRFRHNAGHVHRPDVRDSNATIGNPAVARETNVAIFFFWHGQHVLAGHVDSRRGAQSCARKPAHDAASGDHIEQRKATQY